MVGADGRKPEMEYNWQGSFNSTGNSNRTFLRPVTTEQLEILEEERKKQSDSVPALNPVVSPCEERRATDFSVVVEQKQKSPQLNDTTTDLNANASELPLVITQENDGHPESERNKDRMGDGEAHERFLVSVQDFPRSSNPPPGTIVEPIMEITKHKEKTIFKAKARDYFKQILSLIMKPSYLIHVVHFAMVDTIINKFYVKESVCTDKFL